MMTRICPFCGGMGKISGLSGPTAFFLGQARHSMAWEEAQMLPEEGIWGP